MNEKQNKRKVSKAISNITLHHTFYAMLLLNQKMVYTRDIPTMATDGKKILINLDFVDMCSPAEVMGVLVHELWHAILYHITRRGNRDPQMWNAAGDYAINPIIKSEGFKLPGQHLDDPKYHGKTADAIYKELMKDKKNGQPPDFPIELLDIIEPDGKTEAERTKDEQDMKISIAKALNVAGDKVPDTIKKMLANVLQEKVDWRSKLRDFVQVSLGDDLSTWKRPNRNYLYQGLYLQSKEGRALPRIAVMLDTSGSIYHQKELFEQFAAEIRKIVADMVPESVDIFYVDTQVNRHDTWEEGEEPEFHLEGGGGTDFRSAWPIMEHTDPACIVAFTDMWADFPEHSSVPTLWMCYENKNPRVPFGEVCLCE